MLSHRSKAANKVFIMYINTSYMYKTIKTCASISLYYLLKFINLQVIKFSLCTYIRLYIYKLYKFRHIQVYI